MKSLSLFIISLAIYTVCSAQNPVGSSSDGTSGSDTTNTYQQENYNAPANQNQNMESGNEWNRSDYYETRKEPENVRYYSGGHRGTNIINEDNSRDSYRMEEARNRMGENQFPDLVRIYSGGYYGNNVINKEEVNRAKSYYYEDPTSSQDNYQSR